MKRKADVEYKEFPNDVVIYANTPKGAGWIAKHLTSNVADLHYTDKQRAFQVLGHMSCDGLRTEKLPV